MKITVQVDLSEFYSEDDDASFSEQIKSQIAHEVRMRVLEDWKKKIEEGFNLSIREEIDKHKDKLVQQTMEELVRDEKLFRGYSNDGAGKVSIRDFIIEKLKSMYVQDGLPKQAMDKEIAEHARALVKQLKDRYDILFASQIVSKLNEQGMLKEDVAKILLG